MLNTIIYGADNCPTEIMLVVIKKSLRDEKVKYVESLPAHYTFFPNKSSRSKKIPLQIQMEGDLFAVLKLFVVFFKLYTAFGAYLFHNVVRHLRVVREFHNVGGTPLRAGPKIGGISEHFGKRHVRL